MVARNVWVSSSVVSIWFMYLFSLLGFVVYRNLNFKDPHPQEESKMSYRMTR